ncbi:SMAD/FHA domain-containing protein [Fimicolochytrium jonesii]|uniref:SMAD/FHA domain-containing protein n=1 Tax=Fimicolochytrium jonesii TaxID=1396493 RepID=UPI0022FE40B9|nr:SMAD/FHA domain-containing protein [Fimicolochytrium jonesii]KAI8821346.1 SMAD/FHA domain-containing protein [Fimicolochytrium jonesii]
MGLQVIEHAPESDATLTLVVIRSKLLQPGSIVLVDGKGLTIGRESSEFDRRLVLNELSVSRVHCSLRTRREPTPPPKQRLADYFFVTDVGSTHGTTLNNVRLSEAKKASQPQMLKHGDVLAIGSTVLKAHIHPEWPCTDCRVTSNNVVSTEPRPKKATASVKTDPPPSQDSTNNSGNATDKTALEKTRRAELRRLKREALGGDASADKPKYIDRAALRRQMHGLSAEPPAAEIGYDTGIGGNSPAPSRAHQSSYNTPRRAYDDPTPYEDPPVMGVGGRMLQKMGWTAGQGLGAAGDGRVEPVAVTMRQNRVGLGMDHGASETMKGGDRHQHGKETLKQATMRKARERFLAMNDE